MVYLNHAATTYPKPKKVQESVAECIIAPPQSQYRSIAKEQYSDDVMKLCRGNLAQLFQIREPERIFFTSGATQALNMAILGLESERTDIVITATEHNAVLRTIYDGLRQPLEQGRYRLTVVPCDEGGYIDMAIMKQSITERTALVVVNHCSNVTGAVQNVEVIGKWCRERSALFLVDASQSAGALPIDVESMHIDLLAFTAHKGLYGIEGCGGLYVRRGITLRPILFGGTGIDSRTMIPTEPFYEVGTGNAPGIAALNAGVAFILETGPETIRQKEKELMTLLYQGMQSCQRVKIFGDRQPEGTALSFLVEGLSPSDTGYILSGSYGIIVRTGLHCAPLIHQYMGTEKEGTVRVSISYMTSPEDILYFLKSIREITEGLSA